MSAIHLIKDHFSLEPNRIMAATDIWQTSGRLFYLQATKDQTLKALMFVICKQKLIRGPDKWGERERFTGA